MGKSRNLTHLIEREVIIKFLESYKLQMTLRRCDNEIKVVGSIDRINKYGEAGDCAPQEIERFCYCLKKKATKKPKG